MPATFKRFAIAALLIGSSGLAQAQTQGTLGNPSTGIVTIEASVPPRVQISGLEDINLLNSDPTVDAVKAQNVCVWSNTASRRYSIMASGNGAASAFTLANAAATATVPYSVEWADASGLTAGDALVKSTPLPGQASSATSVNCSAYASETASLIVKIGAADLQGMSASDTYSGTLTLVVAPE